MQRAAPMFFSDGEFHLNVRDCSCGRRHENPYGPIIVRSGELERVPASLRALDAGSSLCLVADPNTFAVAGERLQSLLAQAGYSVTLSLLDASGGVKPAAPASGTVLLDMKLDTDFFVAVGSGTITDVTRFVAARTGTPFVSVPTAPSVDAYASTTSPMTHHGFKSSLPGDVARSIHADVEIMVDAPAEMIAAGFGDTVGKLIGRCDWKLSNLVTGEHHCAEMEENLTTLVNQCAVRAADIGAREPEAVALLTECLMISGAAMTILDSTRSASGSEHALSHYWEMRAGNLGLPATLHGTKVGVGSVVMATFWDRFRDRLRSVDPDTSGFRSPSGHRRDLATVRSLLEPELGPIAGILLGKVAGPRILTEAQLSARLDRYRSSWQEVAAIATEVPAAGDFADQLRAAGGPAYPAELGVGSDELRTALLCATEVRPRYTVLHAAEDLGWLPQIVDEVVQILER